MPMVSGYTTDVFISYSHIDNEPFGHPGGGWVDIFHEHLQNFINVRLGRATTIWRDKRLSGADVFSAEIERQLRGSAVLVSVLSPGYLQSDWCNRELVNFSLAAGERGDLRVGNLQRIVKVLRLPIERSVLPPILDEVLGTQFYRVDPASGRARDLLLDARPEAIHEFRAGVDDVADDVSRLLRAMGSPAHSAGAHGTAISGTVFLAWATGDLVGEREKLRRELEARNYRVVPEGVPPHDVVQLRQRIAHGLREASVAIHLIGAHYGYIPEGEERSVIELQLDDAYYRDANSTARRVIWLAPGVEARDHRLQSLLKRIEKQTPHGVQVDLLANQSVEDLKTLVLDRLRPALNVPRPSNGAESASVYLMCDPLDRPTVTPIRDYLFDHALEVRLPLFDGDAEQIRGEHYETLKECHGVLIYWGKAKEGWLRTMLRDMNKVFGLGRTDPYKAASIYLAELPDGNKESFRTRAAEIIAARQGFEPSVLHPFVTQLTGV